MPFTKFKIKVPAHTDIEVPQFQTNVSSWGPAIVYERVINGGDCQRELEVSFQNNTDYLDICGIVDAEIDIEALYEHVYIFYAQLDYQTENGVPGTLLHQVKDLQTITIPGW